MTADGKIATSTGHSAWVSSTASRQLVFETRAHSDAVIVGGNTVRALWPAHLLHGPNTSLYGGRKTARLEKSMVLMGSMMTARMQRS